ncbi:MAG: cation:dicarboxylase symporter family transporter [Sinobacterium sp.]|nr:cation:dicarboxylase symporter family transporter [Sinobacterium sp.]
MSFTKQILLGLFFGVSVGLFLGEYASSLSTAGDIYIALLQMTVLPYIVVSLVANLGRISWAESRSLLLSAIWVLGILLSLGMMMLIVIPHAFPEWQSGAFFRTALIEPSKTLDLVALYIPANPFSSLANNVVPAVVLFSILLGVGISGVPGSSGFLQGLDVIEAGLNRINKMVIKLTPIGVFAIAAGTASSISLDELSRLQAYLITYSVIALVMSFIVLPLLVSAVTPFRYRDLLSIPKDTLIMIFAAAKIIVLMPQLVENVKTLFKQYDLHDENVESGAEVLMPLAYPFPNLGTYIILMFVPFSAWYMGRSLDLSDQAIFQVASLLSSFVAPIIGIPFLLDLMHIPNDMMELFMMSTVYTDRIRVVLGAVHLLSLTVVVLSIRRGVFKWNAIALLKAIGISVLAIVISLTAVRLYLNNVMDAEYTGDKALVEMRRMDRTVPVTVYKNSLPEATVQGGEHLNRIAQIKQRGTVRVAYLAEALPFAFSNQEGEVVGFDIEMAHRLAFDLGVNLELIRVKHKDINTLFASGQIDIVMSGIAITAQRALEWEFSVSPMDFTLALLVEDHRRKEFTSLSGLQDIPNLKLGTVMSDAAFKHLLAYEVPSAELVNVSSPRAFLKGDRPSIDAIVYSAEGGSAWTLLYPAYSVVVPEPRKIKLSMAYPTPKNDIVWARFVSEWVTIKKKEGTVSALFDHWIEGKGAEDDSPRWSVIRNILHWVD